jgi:hypothetical protein
LIIGSGSSVIVTATNNIVCTGSNLPLSATAVATGGNAPILIDWFYNGNVQVGSGPNYSPATPGQLLVYAEDADGCWDTAFVYIDYTLSSINTPTNITKCGFFTLPWGQIATTTGTYNNVYLNAAGCDSNVIFNVTITGISFTGKVFLHNASIALGLDQVPNTFSLMRDNLRTLGLIPLSSPYTLNTTNNPYSPVFTMVNAPVETTTAAVLAVSGNNAIVDWVFLELRNASNSSTVLYTRSALLQRDGDIVDMDGTSPVNFCTASIGNYFVAIRHRNHLGVMTATTRFFNSSANVDFTSISTPLFLKLAPNNNPSPFNGAAEVKFGMRFLYGANCSILSVPESKTVTYNALPTSDRNRLFNRTLGSITIPGYSVYDVNFDGQARYNNLNNDRLTILRMVNSNNAFTIIEQLP